MMRKNFSNIAASEVAFYSGNTLVATTLSPNQQAELGQQTRNSRGSLAIPDEIKLGNERYLATSVNLSADGSPQCR